MGKRGPSRTPTRVLESRGSWRAKARRGEPIPQLRQPRCPAWMPKAAKAVWRNLIPQLQAMSILGKCDRNALTRYCTLFARWRTTEEWLSQHPHEFSITDPKDPKRILAITEVPHVRRAERLADKLLALEKQFGLTPAARADLAVEQSNPDENRGKDRFFNHSSRRPNLKKSG